MFLPTYSTLSWCGNMFGFNINQTIRSWGTQAFLRELHMYVLQGSRDGDVCSTNKACTRTHTCMHWLHGSGYTCILKQNLSRSHTFIDMFTCPAPAIYLRHLHAHCLMESNIHYRPSIKNSFHFDFPYMYMYKAVLIHTWTCQGNINSDILYLIESR